MAEHVADAVSICGAEHRKDVLRVGNFRKMLLLCSLPNEIAVFRGILHANDKRDIPRLRFHSRDTFCLKQWFHVYFPPCFAPSFAQKRNVIGQSTPPVTAIRKYRTASVNTAPSNSA